METLYDVLRHLASLLGAGEAHEKALQIINQADPAHPDNQPEAEAPASTEGTHQP
jgi:hypothetical protein